MRYAVLSLLVCFTLSACESMPSMDNFNLSQFNPFAEKEPVSNVEFKETDEAQTAAAASDQDALQTELQEIEMLTGSKPVVVRQQSNDASLSTVADNNIETIREDIDPVFEKPVIEQQEATFNQGDENTTPEQTQSAQATQPADDYIEIAEAESAPAAPQAEVKSQPTVDSIKWNTPRQQPQPTQEAAAAPSPSPAPEPQPVQQQPQSSSVQSLSMTRNPNLPPEVKGCPSLKIMPSARSITNFEDGSSGGNMTSRASIQDVKGGCEAVDGGMEIDLDIIMKGVVTNAGRFEGNRNLEAFITFPYFVSVTTPSGAPLNKEIMATAFRFKPMVDDLDHAEKITQFIPMEDVTQAHEYGVTVGFQLTRKQLEYNKAETMMRADDKRASPDTSAANKKSYNPLAGE